MHSINNKDKMYTIEIKQKKYNKKDTTYTNILDC